MKLSKIEHLAALVAAVTAIFVAIKVVWKQLVRSYKYLQDSDQRQEMLRNIMDTLEHKKEVNRAIMDKIGLGYFQTDPEGYTVALGDVVCKMFGYTEDDLLGLNWTLKIVDEDREKVMHAFDDSIKYKTDFEQVYRINCGDGSVKKIHVHAKKTPLGYFGIATSIK